MSQQVYANPQDAVNKPYIDQRVKILEDTISPGMGVAGKLAFFDALGNLSDANIDVTGTNNDLTFDNNTTLFVDNIQSTDGDLNLGGGITNVFTVTSSNSVAIDATNTLTLGHAGSIVTIADTLDAQAITVATIQANDIDSTAILTIGASTPTMIIDATGTLTLGHVGSIVTIADALNSQSIDTNTIDSTSGALAIGLATSVVTADGTAAITIGQSTPAVTMDATSSIIIGHPTLPITINNHVQVDTINTNAIQSSTGTLALGSTTPTINFGNGGAGTINVPFSTIFNCAQIDAVGSTFLYNSSNSIQIGSLASTVAIRNNLLFAQPFAQSMNFFADVTQGVVTGAGPFTSRTVGSYVASRLNTIVTIVFRWTIAGVVATANSILTLTPSLADPMLPIATNTGICRTFVSGVAAQGAFRVTSAGVITVFPVVAGQWLIGETVLIETICMSYGTAV